MAAALRTTFAFVDDDAAHGYVLPGPRRTPVTNPYDLAGEDRAFGGNHLFIDLIPAACWLRNVRTCVTAASWNRLRAQVYARCDYTCECCGARPDRGLEAHERWSFTEETGVQKLERLVGLCYMCHLATHMGRAEAIGQGDAAMAHLRRVRGWTEEEAERHSSDAFRLWAQRNRRAWTLDLSVLTDAGVRLKRRPAARAEDD